MNKQKMGLGKGLSTILGEIESEMSSAVDSSSEPQTLAGLGQKIVMIKTEAVIPSSFQPRKKFVTEAIEDLVKSVTEQGVLQPILVRASKTEYGCYEIIAGERRWRAATAAGLKEIPALIKDFSDIQTLEAALVENLQRENLAPLEEAAAYHRLAQDFSYTQEQIAAKIGKSRSYITNTLRLLSLPEEIKELLNQGKLTAGHARTLLNVPNPIATANEIIAKGLSVRQAEALSTKGSTDNSKTRKNPKLGQTDKPNPAGNTDIAMLESELESVLNMPVSLKVKQPSGKGTLSISFASFEQLDDLFDFIVADKK